MTRNTPTNKIVKILSIFMVYIRPLNDSFIRTRATINAYFSIPFISSNPNVKIPHISNTTFPVIVFLPNHPTNFFSFVRRSPTFKRIRYFFFSFLRTRNIQKRVIFAYFTAKLTIILSIFQDTFKNDIMFRALMANKFYVFRRMNYTRSTISCK